MKKKRGRATRGKRQTSGKEKITKNTLVMDGKRLLLVGEGKEYCKNTKRKMEESYSSRGGGLLESIRAIPRKEIFI